MKHLLKKLLILCAIITATSFASSFVTPQPVSAANTPTDCRYVLGMVSWDCNTGFTECTTKSGKTTCKPANLDEDKIRQGIWTAISNVITDITVIAAYLVIGFVIYGGYRYILSGGDPAKVASGKKTLTQAFIGLAIVMCSNVIMNTIRIALGANFTKDCATTNACTAPDVMVQNTIQWAVGVAGVVAVIFLVYGGISYITSAGEPNKVQQAKKMITYALIGLIIVALVEVITAFVGSTIREAGGTASINETIIAKEIYEINT